MYVGGLYTRSKKIKSKKCNIDLDLVVSRRHTADDGNYIYVFFFEL